MTEIFRFLLTIQLPFSPFITEAWFHWRSIGIIHADVLLASLAASWGQSRDTGLVNEINLDITGVGAAEVLSKFQRGCLSWCLSLPCHREHEHEAEGRSATIWPQNDEQMLRITEGKRKHVWAPEDCGMEMSVLYCPAHLSLHEKIQQGISPQHFKPVFFRSLSHSWNLAWLILVTEPDLDSTPCNCSQLRVFSTTCATYK